MAEFDNEWLRRLYQLQKRVEEMPRRRPGFLADPDLDPIIDYYWLTGAKGGLQ